MLCLCLSLVGCGRGGADDLDKFLSDTRKKANESAKNEPKPIVKLPRPVSYKAGRLANPFAPSGVTPASQKTAASPLQAYPINMLRLIGTVTDGLVTIAYILAPDKKVYTVSKGDLLGDRGGIIILVQPGRLNVMEQDIEDGKQGMQRVITLELKDSQQ